MENPGLGRHKDKMCDESANINFPNTPLIKSAQSAKTNLGCVTKSALLGVHSSCNKQQFLNMLFYTSKVQGNIT